MNELNMNADRVPFAFFGTPYVARDTLAALVSVGYVPSVVVTQPDAPRGRGLELGPSETKLLAGTLGVPALAPAKLDAAFVAQLQEYGCQYAIVVAYGKLLPQAVIDVFPLGLLNIHYSLLPKYRGASPVEAALLAGETGTGVTVQRLTLQMDAGDILAQQAVAIDANETSGELRARLIASGTGLLIGCLPAFIAGATPLTPQDESQATFAGKIAKEEGLLSLRDDPEINWRKYRAYHESPGTFFYARKGSKRIRIKILRASRTGDLFVIGRIVPESRSEQDYAMLLHNGWTAE